MVSAPSAWIVALYRRLARAAPARFRDHLLDDQVALFEELWRTEGPPGVIRRGIWLAAMFARAAGAVALMHLDSRRRTAPRLRRRSGAVVADARQAVRSIRRAPWYALTFTAVVALGVALAATVFALVDGVLFKPLPYRAPDELHAIRGRFFGEALDRDLARAEVDAFRRAVPEATFTAFGSIVGNGTLGVVNGPTVWRWIIDRDLWTTLGVRPAIGGFAPGDFEHEQSPRPVVITDRLWQRIFARDADVIGRRIDVGPMSYRVAGILARGFVFPTGDGLAVPDILEASAGAGLAGGSVIARIPRHMSIPSLQERLTAAARSVAPADAHDRPFDAIEILPLRDVITSDQRTGSLLAFGAVAMLVLLVAVNVGGLAGSHALDRARELAARRALGASTFDLARLQFIEVGLLVAAASGAGLVLARLLLIETGRRLPDDLVLLREPAIDARVITAAAGAALFVAIATTLASMRATGRRPLAALLGQGAGAPVARARSGGHVLLQGGQVALAMLLVVGGMLFLTSVRNLWRADTGYTMTDTLYIDVRVSGTPGTDAPLARALELLEVLRAVPGVEQASVIDTLLLEGFRRGNPFRAPSPEVKDETQLIPVSSQFFALAGLRAIDGRLPTDAELDAGAPVAVVSARTARAFWPGRPAVGQILGSARVTLSVIGVVPDSRFQGLDRVSTGEVYAPIRLGLWRGLAPTYLLRAAVPDGEIMPVLLDTIRRFDPGASIRRAQPVSLALAESITRQRFHAWLFGGLAVASLIVAAAGILGLVAMATARRTREMGVRLALGSTHDRLMRLLLREQLPPIVAGLVAGGIAAAWAAGFIRSLLYELSIYDGGAWALSVGLVLAAAAAGTLIPAARLRRIDPVSVLRD